MNSSPRSHRPRNRIPRHQNDAHVFDFPSFIDSHTFPEALVSIPNVILFVSFLVSIHNSSSQAVSKLKVCVQIEYGLSLLGKIQS